MHGYLPEEDLDLVLRLTPEFWSRFGGARLFMTGGTGFIGRWLLQVFQRANDVFGSRIELVVLLQVFQRANDVFGSRIELVVLSRDPVLALCNAPLVFGRSDTRLVGGDIRNFDQPAGKFDLLVHAATDVGDPTKIIDPVHVFDSIVLGTRRALDLADSSGVLRFLLTSSGAVYGTQPTSLERISEAYEGAIDPLLPSGAYGNGKRAAEWLVSACAAQSGFTACMARIYALIGPGIPLNGPFAAGNFIRDALAGRTIEVHGDGRPLRSYLYMADLCVWLLRILESGRQGQAYNVGSEQALSISELAHQVVRASGTTVQVLVATAPAVGPAPRYVPDTAKARGELGLEEYTDLESALRKTFNWSRSTITE